MRAIGVAVLAGLMAAGASAQGQQAPAPGSPPLDRSILHVQVILDMLGFGPGVLDGRGGQSLVAALKGFQEARGLPVTGRIDPATLRVLYQYRAKRPTVTLTLDQRALAGPYVNPLPKDYGEQAKLPSIAYATPVEKLAERFHTTPEVLAELNPGARLVPGARVTFPNALPGSRQYDSKFRPDWQATLNGLNIDARQPQADHLVVDKSDGVLRVFDAGNRLIAQFSATMGSSHDPLPLGSWKIYGSDYNPKFKYNPDLFWDAKRNDEKALLPAGPNGPVGVVWIDLSKEHYGIHGTPHPETIGRAESHGCIRLTNWDAARLSMMVKPGTRAVFQA